MTPPAIGNKSMYIRTAVHLYGSENALAANFGPGVDEKLPEHVPATADEPLAAEFSIEKAAKSLDTSAIAWQKVNQCSQCHANFMNLIARPAVPLAPAREV